MSMGKSVDEIRQLLDKSNDLFLGKDPFPVDGGAVLRRNVIPFADESSPLQFMEWFNNRIISALGQDEDLNTNQRVFFLSGRAGQGKSTLVRNMFLHLKNQEYYDENLPRLRPNYTREIDRNLSEFFNQYRDSVEFYQARDLASQTQPPHFSSRTFVIVDGIDEATDDRIHYLAEMISNNKSSLFFISSRSRYAPSSLGLSEEIINQHSLVDELKKQGVSIDPLKNSIFLNDMEHEEKKDILRLIQDFDGGDVDPMLDSLVENNSKLLRRPADFLLFRAHTPKDKTEYLIRHLAWLIRREENKDLAQRKDYIERLKFPNLFSGKNSFDVKDGKFRVDFGSDEQSKNAMQLFNLIEVEGKSEHARVYLDLTTPSSQAIVLLSAGGFTAHQLYYLQRLHNELQLAYCPWYLYERHRDPRESMLGGYYLDSCMLVEHPH